MASKYEVEGSDNCKRIKELSLLQQQLLTKAIAISNAYGISVKETEDSINNTIERYKDYVRTNYIFKDPKAASSYFALFQMLGGRHIFQPQESELDIRTFAAVATAWDTYYNDEDKNKIERAENLHNIAIEGLKALRIKQAKKYGPAIDPDKIQVVSVFDIPLIDNKGKKRSLTEFKGKVVLLDFHAFSMPNSMQRIMMLRDVYNKYHAQGLEIYQVSVDDNEHYWKTQTAALPWVCVHDPDGVDSEYLQKYNVTQIPTFFLIDRNNSLDKRDSQIKDLDSAIQSLL
jgi:peroxiredoxin